MGLYRVRLTLQMYVEADDEQQACELAQNDLPSCQLDLVDWDAKLVEAQLSVKEAQ